MRMNRTAQYSYIWNLMYDDYNVGMEFFHGTVQYWEFYTNRNHDEQNCFFFKFMSCAQIKIIIIPNNGKIKCWIFPAENSIG